MSKFDTIEYLKNGNEKQRNVFRILTENRVMDRLVAFSPILTGTIPIQIDTDESDLDITCYWQNVDEFKSAVFTFSNFLGFTVVEKEIKGYLTIIARFSIDHFAIEIFGQNRPVKEQESYRHMVIEHQIIQQKGEGFRLKVVEQKKRGVKTKPAFGLLLGLKGNPYEALLKYDVT